MVLYDLFSHVFLHILEIILFNGVYLIIGGCHPDNKTGNVSVLLCGQLLPPEVIIKGKSIQFGVNVICRNGGFLHI